MNVTRTRRPGPKDLTTGLLYWFNDRSLAGYANADPVGLLYDLSGRQGHLHSSFSQRPLASGGVQGGRMGLVFSGASSTSMSGGVALITGGQARTIFVVCRPEFTNPTNASPVFELNGDLVGATATGFNFTFASSIRTNAGRADYTNSTSGQIHLYTIRASGGTSVSGMTLRIDQVEQAQTGTLVGNLVNTGSGGLCLGYSPSQSGGFWRGQLCELRIYQGYLTDAQILQVERKLRNYWRLP